MEPADARWSGTIFEIDPDDTGDMCRYQGFADSDTGNVAITTLVLESYGHTVEESASFTCR